jgi:DNA-binding transcriptional MerR regulator
MDMEQLMAIGAVSNATGGKVPTIRYYEEAGLLPAPPRTASGRRLYGPAAVNRLTFIRHARALGFDLGAIRDLLAMTEEPQASCHRADSIARQHLEQVRKRIAQLNALKDELERMIAECRHGRLCDCRVMEVLADHSECRHEHASGDPV